MKKPLKKNLKKKSKKQLKLILLLLFFFAIIFLFLKKDDKLKEKKENIKERKKILIVMDDLGQNKEDLNWFLENKIKIALSFLPQLPFTKEMSEKLYKAGYEIILHIPMEPEGYPKINPGENALLLADNKEEILKKLNIFIAEVPFAKGVNNHMGSAFTSNFEKMVIFFEILKEKNLFFLDSRTTEKTKGFKASKTTGLRFFERDVFLDNLPEENYIKKQFKILFEKSKKKGYSIGICHPKKGTFEFLKKYKRYIEGEGELLSFRDLINSKI